MFLAFSLVTKTHQGEFWEVGDYLEISVKERLDHEESDFDKWFCGWCGFDEDCSCKDEDITGCLDCGVMLTPEEMEEHLLDVEQRKMKAYLAEKAEKEREQNIQENNS